MICYKHAWMKQWQDGYQTSPEFAARQTDPNSPPAMRPDPCGTMPASAFPVSELEAIMVAMS